MVIHLDTQGQWPTTSILKVTAQKPKYSKLVVNHLGTPPRHLKSVVNNLDTQS